MKDAIDSLKDNLDDFKDTNENIKRIITDMLNALGEAERSFRQPGR